MQLKMKFLLGYNMKILKKKLRGNEPMAGREGDFSWWEENEQILAIWRVLPPSPPVDD